MVPEKSTAENIDFPKVTVLLLSPRSCRPPAKPKTLRRYPSQNKSSPVSAPPGKTKTAPPLPFDTLRHPREIAGRSCYKQPISSAPDGRSHRPSSADTSPASLSPQPPWLRAHGLRIFRWRAFPWNGPAPWSGAPTPWSDAPSPFPCPPDPPGAGKPPRPE